MPKFLALLIFIVLSKVAFTQNTPLSLLDSAKKDSTIFVSLETPPQYPGGANKLYEFLGRNIKYPKAARKTQITGVVVVSFVIEKDGTPNDFEIIKSVEKSLDEETLRVMKLMSRWSPGYQDGKAVRVKYTIPMTFSITN